jgi:hypothetical protein
MLESTIKLANNFYKLSIRRHEREGYSVEDLQEMNPEFIDSNSLLDTLEGLVSNEEEPNYYFRFSDTPSLTINPSFDYSNTLGIYAYPLTKEIFKRFKTRNLQMQDKKYVLIFSPKDKSKILYGSKYSRDDLNRDLLKLFDYARQHFNLTENDLNVLLSGYGFDNVDRLISAINDFNRYLKDKHGKYLFDKSHRYNSNLPYRVMGYIGRYFVPNQEVCFFSGAYLNDPIILENKYSA